MPFISKTVHQPDHECKKPDPDFLSTTFGIPRLKPLGEGTKWQCSKCGWMYLLRVVPGITGNLYRTWERV